MLLTVFNIAVFTSEMLTMYAYCRNIFHIRTNKKTTFLLVITGYFFLFTVNMTFDNTLINIVCLVFVNIILIFRGFDCHLQSAAFHSIILIAVMMSTETLVILLVSRVLHLDISHYSENVTTYIIDGILCKTLYFVICRNISAFSPKEKGLKTSGKSWYLLILPVTTVAILLIFRYFAEIYEISQTLILLFSFAGILLMLSTILVYFVYETIQRDHKRLLDLEVEKQKQETDKTYFEVLDDQVSEMKILIHDIKNHLGAIRSISNEPAVINYIDSIYDDMIKYSKFSQSGNKILDLVISKYSSLCSLNDVRFTANTHSSNLSFMEDIDVTTMLNNILDNALDSAENSEKKYIEFAVYNKNPFYVITVINSCDSPPEIKSFNLITSKENKSVHGYGTKSIKKIAEKYNGNFSWFYDELAKNFHATVMIPESSND